MIHPQILLGIGRPLNEVLEFLAASEEYETPGERAAYVPIPSEHPTVPLRPALPPAPTRVLRAADVRALAETLQAGRAA